jgi:hypothetical protein
MNSSLRLLPLVLAALASVATSSIEEVEEARVVSASPPSGSTGVSREILPSFRVELEAGEAIDPGFSLTLTLVDGAGVAGAPDVVEVRDGVFDLTFVPDELLAGGEYELVLWHPYLTIATPDAFAPSVEGDTAVTRFTTVP